MKKLTKVVLVWLAIFATASPLTFADTHTINVTADVAPNFSMSVKLFRQIGTDDFAQDITASSTFDFGELADIGTGTLRSNSSPGKMGAGMAYITVISNSGNGWKLEQTGGAMVSGSNQLPDGACSVVPVYVASDNGDVTDGSLGAKGTWVESSKLLYSRSTAAQRTIRAYYSITDDPAAGATTGVPNDQPTGTYATTVTFTSTLL